MKEGHFLQNASYSMVYDLNLVAQQRPCSVIVDNYLSMGRRPRQIKKEKKKREFSVYVRMYLCKNSKCHLVSFGIKIEADWT